MLLEIIAHTPSRLIIGALAGAAVAILLAALLGWHALRRLLNVPRVPRPPSMYVVLVALWTGVVGLAGAAVAMALLLRDHQPVETPTRLAEVRCQAVGPDRVQLELRAAVAGKTASAADPERYEVSGDACVVSLVLVELRPSLGFLGPTHLLRIGGVGSSASARERPSMNPSWLTPRAQSGMAPIDLLVQGARTVSLPVPAGGDRFYLTASPDGPALEKAGQT